MLKAIIGMLVSASLLATAACNTVQGVGKDVQRGGEVIERSAE